MALPTLENGNGSNRSNNLEQPAATTKQHSCDSPVVEAVHELGNEFQDKLLVKDENFQCCNNLSFGNSMRGIMEDEDPSGGGYEESLDGSMETSSSKCFKKFATFPVTIGAEKNDEFQVENKSLSRSSSLPTNRKLVSALKGGREKEGMPPKKLSVSWAPDVYDPLPTSVSHYPKKKSQKHYKSSKKNGKGKQKAKNTRGSGGSKDKKHNNNRKNGGSSERSMSSYSDKDNDRAMSSNNHKLPLGFLDFEHHGDEIGGHEPNCGSSFRGKACGGTVHFAYAEAT